MRKKGTARRLAVSLMLSVCTCGCHTGTMTVPTGMGLVEGRILMDGLPLADAFVAFYPLSGGRPSFGMTDENGHYEMIHTNDTDGVLVGDCRAVITTFCPPVCGGCADPPMPGRPEEVPVVYNEQSTLTVGVSHGMNTIDFHLDSKAGPIQQPI